MAEGGGLLNRQASYLRVPPCVIVPYFQEQYATSSHETITRIPRANQAPVKVFPAPFGIVE